MDFLKSNKHESTQDFINQNLEMGMLPTITRPTRVTKTSATLIDNIVVSMNYVGKYSSNVLIDNVSNHLPSILLLSGITAHKKESVLLKSRDLRKRNLDALKQSLDNTNFEELVVDNDLNTSFNKVHGKLLEQINWFVPETTHSICGKKLRREPWISAGLLKSIAKCKKLYRDTLKSTCTDKTRSRYVKYNAMLCKVKRSAMKMYYHNKCSEYKHNTSKLWRMINEIVGRVNDKSCVIDHITVNGVTDYTAHGIGNAFGKFFANVGKRYAKKILKSKKHIDEYLTMIRRNQTSIFFEPTSIAEINKLLKGLPNESSSGHDNVNNLLLKELAEQISPILELLFNESLVTGQFPDKMKIADVVPLYKAKEHDIVDNYRPILLLLTISKVLERIVYKRVYKYLNDTGQIYESQYGFREKHSCDHAIAQLIGEIVKNQELKRTTISVFLDLSKAFDTLTHSIVLKKLEQYGIRRQTLKWFESYLSGCRLRVKFRPASTGQVEVTDEYDIEYGAPQGSCLGPLIFLVFCNDLSLHLEFLQCIQFADDTTLYLRHRNKHYLRYCVESDLIGQIKIRKTYKKRILMELGKRVFRTGQIPDINCT